jgi:hypothetical protein
MALVLLETGGATWKSTPGEEVNDEQSEPLRRPAGLRFS